MMKRRMRLDGKWNGQADGLGSFEVSLPGTLDTNGIGSPDEERLATRLTRLHRYEGKMRYSRQIRMPSLAGQGRLFLRIERTRELTLEIDGAVQTAFDKGTLSTPWLFEVTGYAGRNVKIVLTVDNAYTEYPRESVIGASAVTDETQTNWNGVIGDFSVYETDDLILKDLRILPTETGLEISMEADGQFPEEDITWDVCTMISCSLKKPQICGKNQLLWTTVSRPSTGILPWHIITNRSVRKKPGKSLKKHSDWTGQMHVSSLSWISYTKSLEWIFLYV